MKINEAGVLRKLPTGLELDLVKVDQDALKRGLAARRRVLFLCGLVLVVLLVGLVTAKLSEALTIAITIAVASLCVVYATMTLSAALNRQMDVLGALVVHYAERRNPSDGGKAV